MVDARILERLSRIDKVAPDNFASEINFCGVNFHVDAGVFNPAKGKSARKMSRAIELCPPSSDARIVEIGTGCGVLSSLLWLRGCRHILATDIMPIACTNARHTFSTKDFNIEVIQSDLFENVQQDFDYVVFNAPATHPSRIDSTNGSITLWDPEGNLKGRFVDEVRRMKPKGRIKALFMYSRYNDFDPLSQVNFSDFDVSYLLVEKDDISETGVILLTRD